MHGFSNVCSFTFSPGEFEPAIFPIPSSCLNPQDLPVHKHAKCPDPALASSSEPTTADKDFFMALACLAARRSKDPNRQVTAYHHNNYICSYMHAVIDPLTTIILYMTLSWFCRWEPVLSTGMDKLSVLDIMALLRELMMMMREYLGLQGKISILQSKSFHMVRIIILIVL